MQTDKTCPEGAPGQGADATSRVAEDSEDASGEAAMTPADPEQGAETDAPDSDAAPAEEQPEDPATTIVALNVALEAAQEEIESLNDRALRATAEVENVRKRADRSVANAHKFALEKFTADLLPVIDSFERALEAASALASENDAAGSTVEGIELSLRLMNETLGRHGVEAIDPVGEPFNPSFHEAMSMLPNPDAEPGSVLQVVQKGYTLNERLVRPARVLVAKAPE
ncbi:MAG: nucleotide exchange factor GrpE [Gammaproteobacteria bacterium]|nr:nucleotide exchange factor GrpE [Gammaproteobacteria bacterium]